jgi:hypothetical protein
MAFNKSTYKIIKSLKPLELFDIITRGVCEEYLPKLTEEIRDLRGVWTLNNPLGDRKLDLLSFYLSYSGFELLVENKEQAERLKSIFISWDLFFDVYTNWYSDSYYKVGFNYDYDAFDILYLQWKRNKVLNELL